MDDAVVSAEQFQALYDELCNWGRWGDDDQRGALALLTAERIAQATRVARNGRTVTMSLPLNTHRAIDNPIPADHHMTMLGDQAGADEPLRFLKDYIGLDYHNDGHTHLDALCHVAYRGKLYNGRPEDTVTAGGAAVRRSRCSRMGSSAAACCSTFPRLRGVPWLEPGVARLPRPSSRKPQRRQVCPYTKGTSCSCGPVTRAARPSSGPWNTAEATAGLHPSARRLIGKRRVAALGSDGNNDTAPSSTEGVGFPIHVLALTAMGIHLLDYLQFEDVVEACEGRPAGSSCS